MRTWRVSGEMLRMQKGAAEDGRLVSSGEHTVGRSKGGHEVDDVSQGRYQTTRVRFWG